MIETKQWTQLNRYLDDIQDDDISDPLIPYLREMPEEKVKNILRGLRRTVEF